MGRFQREKDLLREELVREDWLRRFEERLENAGTAKTLLGPLLALLPRPELRSRAAAALGKAGAALTRERPEDGRVLMRRLMWSLNEESGNLGWGVPQAMGCILAESPLLAREFAEIFFSYARDTGKEDNYIDYAPLRREVYLGIACLVAAAPELGMPAVPALRQGLDDAGEGNRAAAAAACALLAEGLLRTGRGLVPEQVQAWEGMCAALEVRREEPAEPVCWLAGAGEECEAAPLARARLACGRLLAGAGLRATFE